MRSVIVAAILAAATVVTHAQEEPFLGIWELSLAKSAITRGAPPRIETIVNTTERGGFRSLLATVTDARTTVEVHHYVFDGAFHQTEGSDPRELSFTRVDPRTIQSDTRRNGSITVTRRLELSQDGRTLTVVASGTTGSGQRYVNDTRVYEKH